MNQEQRVARQQFMSEGNEVISQLATAIEKRKPSLMSRALKRLRRIASAPKK